MPEPPRLLPDPPRAGLDTATLLARWRDLPYVDPVAFRRDIDRLIDPSL